MNLNKITGVLRRIRIVHAALNLFHISRLLKNKSYYSKYGINKSILSSVSHADIKKYSDDIPWLDRKDASERLHTNSELNSFSSEIREQLEKWGERGFIILKNFIDAPAVDKINSEIEMLLKKKKAKFHYTERNISNAYSSSSAITAVVNDSELLKLLSFILGKKIKLFQTMNFISGSQADAHSDSIHMTTEPAGYLVAIWLALEDVGQGSGPLFYYPGSHRLPYIMGEHFETGNTKLLVGDNFYENYTEKIIEQIKNNNLKKELFLARKGDLLIWHANLLHGGDPVSNEKKTRKSLVAHYFAEGVLCYHEITQRPAILTE